MEPLISVIVPVYKVEKYLDRCVESIVNQTYTNLEIILVDDGSPDNCPQMCDAWTEKDSRIKVIHKENGGVSSARNAGLDAARGIYIGFVDSDDYIDPNLFYHLYRLITDNKCDCSTVDYYKCNCYDIESNTKISDFLNKNIVDKNGLILRLFYCNEIVPSVWGKLYKKQIIIDNNIRFDTSKKIGEDFLFNFFYFSNSNRGVISNLKLYYYFIRNESAINSNDCDYFLRWKNTKEIINQINDVNLKNICFKKYVSEILVCLRELIKSDDKELIGKCYNQIVFEIKNNKDEFLKLKDISKINKISIVLIILNPSLFCFLYKVTLKIRK